MSRGIFGPNGDQVKCPTHVFTAFREMCLEGRRRKIHKKSFRKAFSKKNFSRNPSTRRNLNESDSELMFESKIIESININT